ncbi:MAG: site-specific integrase, partial [Phocaeicola sp.]
MYSAEKRKGASLYKNVITYTLPKLHQGKNWYVDFSAYDPLEQKMKRKKYMLDGIPKITDRKKRAIEIITNLTIQLRSGWNPWADASNSRQYIMFSNVMELYLNYLTKLESTKAIKEKTLVDYRNRLNILIDYCKNRYAPIVYIYQLDQTLISDFLDHILIDRDCSARTRNNYRIWVSSLCAWLVEKQYIDRNPIEKIKMLTV